MSIPDVLTCYPGQLTSPGCVFGFVVSFCFVLFAVLKTEPKASHILGRHSISPLLGGGFEQEALPPSLLTGGF